MVVAVVNKGLDIVFFLIAGQKNPMHYNLQIPFFSAYITNPTAFVVFDFL